VQTARVLITVKDLPGAKSRLAPSLGEPQRAALVLAMLVDTVTAARRCPAVQDVHVVTADAAVAAAALRAGAEVRQDPTRTLNAALTSAAEGLGTGSPLVALQADLPALRAEELDAALTAADTAGRAAVADAQGTGTTLLRVAAGAVLDPRFGLGSARAHARSGAVLLDGGWPGLRTDVDTVADLGAALTLGVGAATAAVVHGMSTPVTVAGYSDAQVQLRGDDGIRMHSAQQAAELGGWRRLRAGQRLRALLDSDGRVCLLTYPVAAPPG
jgi:2-phospho-L-lactate guanylyltransferase